MSRHRETEEPEIPACYAQVVPGLEPVASDEITRDLGVEVKKAERGTVVFRPPAIDTDLLELRTVEDVFLLAWGTDSLSFRATDLKLIQQWTHKTPKWDQLLRWHHSIRPKHKGRPTYRLVTQMTGTHGYRRVDAGEALARGLGKAIPESWVPAEENAYLEIWLTIRGSRAVCGVRLSDKTMRHRTYKQEHRPAALRPSIAAAMVRLAGAAPSMWVLDPMCGTGTILAEQIELSKKRRAGRIETMGGDIEMDALRASATNLKKVGPATLALWDSRRLPLPNASVDRIISNPPFGKQLSTPEEIAPLYKFCAREWDRVLKPGGRAVLLVSEQEILREALKPTGWKPYRVLRVEVLGQDAFISVWNKESRFDSMEE